MQVYLIVLRSVILLVVSTFLTAISLFIFGHSSSEAPGAWQHYQLHVRERRCTDEIRI